MGLSGTTSPGPPNSAPSSPPLLPVIGYISFFSFAGTLARLGVLYLGSFPAAPVLSPVGWVNMVGCAVMGFMITDQSLFQKWCPSDVVSASDVGTVAKTRLAAKKSVPVFTGITVGFCGSFTSFASMIEDMFLASVNRLATVPGQQDGSIPGRDPGWGVSAVLAVVAVNLGLSFLGLHFGFHVGMGAGKYMPALSTQVVSRIDSIAPIVALVIWMLVSALAAVPESADWHPHSGWRPILLALAFSPFGALTRYFLAVKLNPVAPSFPLGTFAANVAGSALAGGLYSAVRRIGPGSSCLVVTSLGSGFCTCLSTISTWVSELSSLPTGAAYWYGFVSVVAAFATVILTMGSVYWSVGWQSAC